MSDPAAMTRALAAAVKLLAGRSLTRAELVGRLVKRRVPETIAEGAATELERKGLLSDRRAAESGAADRAVRGDAPALIEDKLRARGVDPAEARRAAAGATEGRAEAETALALARKRVRACPPDSDPESMRRRVFAYLARRGYDEDTCAAAVERAVAEVLPR